MSLYENYKRRMQVDTCSTGKNYPTLGEKLKSDSDKVMELTWNNDVQSKKHTFTITCMMIIQI